MGNTIQNMQNSKGIFFLGDDVKIDNLNTAGNQTITNYFGDVDKSRHKNNGDGTYVAKYRLKYGEPDLEDWRDRAEALERKLETLIQKSEKAETINELFFKLMKAIGAVIAKRFGF